MSWSVSAKGAAGSIAGDLDGQFGRIRCDQPEQGIADGVRGIVAQALSAYPASKSVSVSASGSQYKSTDKGIVNSLTVKIQEVRDEDQSQAKKAEDAA